MAGVQLLSSKISINEEPPSLRTLQGVATSILAAVGITERGPHEATLVTSPEEFFNIFGSDTADSELVHAVRGFFENGGTQAYIKRVVHYTDIDSAVTRTSAAATVDLETAAGGPTAARVLGTQPAPYVLAPGDDLDIDRDALGIATATFDATAASRTSGNTDPFALVDTDTLLVAIDSGTPQTITFSASEFTVIGAATAEEVAAVINAQISGASAAPSTGAVVITSDKQGLDSGVEITGGTSTAAFAFPVGNAVGTGDVADIEAVTFFEAKAVIEADVSGVTVLDGGSGALIIQSNTTGAASLVHVQATSTADAKFGLPNAAVSGTTGAATPTLTADGKTDGVYANTISLVVLDASDGETDHFNLQVVDDGNVLETFANLSMVSTDARYAPSLLADAAAGSNLVALTDLALGVRPGNGTYGPMTGGDDGLVGLVDNDFLGSSVSKTGLRGFDQISDIRILIVPGRATPAVHQGMLTFCEQTRCGDCFAVLDPPEDLTTEAAITYFETTAGLIDFSEFGAAYYPWVEVLNPDTEVFGAGQTIYVPPSGHIAGVYARTDASRIGGVYDPPAGIERGRLFGVLGYQSNDTLEEAKRDRLYPKRINPLSVVNGLRVIDGVRTLKSNGNFPTVAERRGVIFIEQTIKNGLEFARFSNNDARLRNTVTQTVRLFLLAQMRAGAFRSQNADEAFTVDFGDALNPASVIFAGQLRGRIGLATQKPAEFITITFTQDTRALEEEALSNT